MSQPDENNSTDGDWENQSELYWTEQEWNRYLGENADEQKRFVTFYTGLHGQAGRLDLAAQQMGWDCGEWTPPGAESDGIDEDATDAVGSSVCWPPYCVQQHPVYIVTRALCSLIGQQLESLCEAHEVLMPSVPSLRLARLFHEIEHIFVMAITSMDTADFCLALTLWKRAGVEINRALKLLETLAAPAVVAHFAGECRSVLFDLREIGLRGIHDAKWELEIQSEGE
jgi:hypothetical protein